MKDLIDAMIYDSKLSKEAKLETLKDWDNGIQASLNSKMTYSFYMNQKSNSNYITEKITELNK